MKKKKKNDPWMVRPQGREVKTKLKKKLNKRKSKRKEKVKEKVKTSEGDPWMVGTHIREK